MAVEVRLMKADASIPWGFRLTGGANFEVPLTTIKVTENSIAEKCGLRVGDIIVKINDDDISQLTHAQAHDKIIQCEGQLILTVVRGELSESLQSLIQEEESNEEVFNIMESNMPTKPNGNSEEDQENEEIQDNLPHHDLNLTDEDIHNIISSEIVTKKEKFSKMSDISKKTILPEENVSMNGIKSMKNDHEKPQVVSTEEVKIMHSNVINEINNNLKEANEPVRIWSTFLQKPQRPVPQFKPKFEVQQSSYRVVIRTKKDLEAEREAKQAEEAAALLKAQRLAEENKVEVEEEILSSEEETASESDSDFTFSSDDQTESTLTFSISGTEPTLSFTESLNSLEDKLVKVKQQLDIYNIELVPDSLQKTLSKIAAQLEKIVKVVKPAVLEDVDKEDETVNDISDDEFEDREDIKREKPGDEIQGIALAPMEPSIEGKPGIIGMGDSQETPEIADPTLSISDNAADIAECDRTEFDVTEIHDLEENAQGEIVPVEDKSKDDGKTSKKEKIEHWNQIWPWTRVTQPIYRYCNYSPMFVKHDIN